MKAWIYERYGTPEVMEFGDIDEPSPGEGEVLVRVRAAGLNAADWRMMRAIPRMVRFMLGLRKPRHPVVPGSDMAGVVESLGPATGGFAPGDEVYAEVETGGLGELVCVKAEELCAKPSNLDFEEAASVPMSGLSALQALRDRAQVRPGQSVLINGGAGGVGTFAVQIAVSLGTEVTAVCHTDHVNQALKLGAHHVIDRTREDFTEGTTRYDVIIDIGGGHPLRRFRKVLASKGTYVMVGGSGGRWLGPGSTMLKATLLSPFVPKRLRSLSETPNAEDLGLLKELIEGGAVKPVVDRVFPLAEAPDAMRYLEEGHPRGKVVVTVSG